MKQFKICLKTPLPQNVSKSNLNNNENSTVGLRRGAWTLGYQTAVALSVTPRAFSSSVQRGVPVGEHSPGLGRPAVTHPFPRASLANGEVTPPLAPPPLAPPRFAG